MYLHLGQNVVAFEPDIIGVFDIDNTTRSHITKRFLSESEKRGQLISVSGEIPRSFIVCSEGNNNKVLLSQLSPQTLLKRTETMKGTII